MVIEEIRWIDRSIREAEVLVSDGRYSVLCFSHPCDYSVGEAVNDPLFCLNVQDVELANRDGYEAARDAWGFSHMIRGKLCDPARGIVCVGGLRLEIDPGMIPKDIESGQFVQFFAGRIDL